jgi:hypothetical protein
MWGERRRSAEPRASHDVITIETVHRILRGQLTGPKQRVLLGLVGAALARALHALGAATAGPVQAEPVPARLQPALDGAALRGVGEGPAT